MRFFYVKNSDPFIMSGCFGASARMAVLVRYANFNRPAPAKSWCRLITSKRDNAMTTPSNTEQSVSSVNKLTVDFSHRLSAAQTAEDSSIIDTIGLMTDRALGVLQLLSIQFDGTGDSRLSDALMCGAIDSVLQEVEDIKATVAAFAKAEHAKGQVQS